MAGGSSGEYLWRLQKEPLKWIHFPWPRAGRNGQRARRDLLDPSADTTNRENQFICPLSEWPYLQAE